MDDRDRPANIRVADSVGSEAESKVPESVYRWKRPPATSISEVIGMGLSLETRILASLELLEGCCNESEHLPPEQQANLIEAVEFLDRVAQFFRVEERRG